MPTDNLILYGLTQEKKIKLHQLALDLKKSGLLTERPSISALVRFVADYGRMENGKLIVESSPKKGE